MRAFMCATWTIQRCKSTPKRRQGTVCNTESVQGRIRTVNSADSIHITRVYLTLQGRVIIIITIIDVPLRVHVHVSAA